ncbi:MAG TPA: septum formation initiator family protein [Terriglobales bacterium]|nr:septum formation initiator family protein [Terriglobales bacterium]
MELAEQIGGWLYRSRRKLASAGVGLLACLLAYHVVFGANGMMAWEQKRSEYRQLQQQIEDLQKQNQQLTEHIQALKSDPAAIEKEAREQLRYVRPGEVIYVVPPAKARTQPPAPAPPPPSATAQRRP